MRFQMKNAKKTLRVYLYDEEDLGWPIRFTKKINPQVLDSVKKQCDNDRSSDEEMIREDI